MNSLERSLQVTNAAQGRHTIAARKPRRLRFSDRDVIFPACPGLQQCVDGRGLYVLRWLPPEGGDPVAVWEGHGSPPDDEHADITGRLLQLERDSQRPATATIERLYPEPPAPPRLPDIPLSAAAHLRRELPPVEYLMGSWLHTASRVLLSAETGLGKTMFTMDLAAHVAAGRDFLHWRGRRRARVLFIDGEMPRQLFRERIAGAVQRVGGEPDGMMWLNTEDVRDFPPLNTKEGLAWLLRFIDEKAPDPDLIVFDNIMALLIGDPREPHAWQQTLPLIKALAARNIAQLWVHHAGHDKPHGYGDQTKEWRMSVVLHCHSVKRADADVSFRLTFDKSRESRPDTRPDYQTVTVALEAGEWSCSASAPTLKSASPKARKLLAALKAVQAGRGPVDPAMWMAECATRGLIDLEGGEGRAKGGSARSQFSRYRRELAACGLIIDDGELVSLAQGGSHDDR